MKIRALTYGISLALTDFDENCKDDLVKRFEVAKKNLTLALDKLNADGYEVQTVRLSFNRIEDWLDLVNYEQQMIFLSALVDKCDVASHVALGCCSSASYISLIPKLFSYNSKFNGSVHIPMESEDGVYTLPDANVCAEAAKVALHLSTLGDGNGTENFRFCIGFNCQPGTPFLPISFFHSEHAHADGISIGLENGYFLFLAFHGFVDSTTKSYVVDKPAAEVSSNASSVADKTAVFAAARRNLKDVLLQALTPLQALIMSICAECSNVKYLGIDASLNPGMTQLDSVGAGMEWLLADPEQSASEDLNDPTKKGYSTAGCFGSFSTLSVVSLITAALKQLVNEQEQNGLLLVGYNGLMLPVMEDVILAKRALGDSSRPKVGEKSLPLIGNTMYTLRDLLVFSTICGVGLDTVPIPGDTSVAELANIYSEVGTLAFRLNKPLSCRLFPMPGKKAGEMTTVENNPYLVNTTVFAVR